MGPRRRVGFPPPNRSVPHHSASRRAFQQKTDEEPRFVPIEQGSPIVESRKQQNPNAQIPKGATNKILPKFAKNEIELRGSEAKSEPQADLGEQEHEPLPSANPNPEVEGDLASMLPLAFKELTLQGLHENFHMGGSAKASSQFPSYVLNRFAISGLQDMNADVRVALSAQLRFGSTQKGSYFGFGLGFEPLYQMPLRVITIPSLDKLLIGGLVKLDSVAVTGEKLGGWDDLSLSPAVHVQGSYHIADLVQTFDYDLAARLTPFGMGQVGIAGKKRKIGSSQGLELEANVIRKMKAQDWEWGGLLAYQTGAWDLSPGAMSFQTLRLGLVGRMRL